MKKEAIVRVKKGLYVFGPELAREPYCKETLANLIYGPSYISLEYALSFYGLIPERVEVITSVTNKRKKYFNTPIGIFSYRYINPSKYSYGITLYEIDQRHSILIATPEKALVDMLHFSNRMTVLAQIEHYLFEDMRFDGEGLSGFNLKRVKRLAKLYGHNAILFQTFLENMK